MSTIDQPHDHDHDHDHGTHHHPDSEGEYEDKDVADGRTEPPVGEYEDHDVRDPRPTEPHDEGSFADHDVVSEHRHPAAEGSFEDAEIPGVDDDVEAVQEERAQHHHTDVTDVTDIDDPNRQTDRPADPV